MESVTYEFAPDRTLEINGKVFNVLMSEDEILDKMLYFTTAYKDVKSIQNEREMQADFLGFCDNMLGKGALKKIVGTHHMSMDEKATLIMRIATVACATYRKKLEGYDE